MVILVGSPIFTHGQVISASYHLNLLADNVRAVAGYVTAPQVPFTGMIGTSDAGVWTTVLRYVVCHQVNSLHWDYAIRNEGGGGSDGRLVINGTTLTGTEITGGNPEVRDSGTYDLTSLGLTVGATYIIEVQLMSGSGTGVATTWWLAEQQAASVDSLLTFADEVVPTAAQWQALQTEIADLATLLEHPWTPMQSRGWNIRSGDGTWHGILRNVGPTLYVSAGLRCHEDADAYLHFFINGAERLTLRLEGGQWFPWVGAKWVTVYPNSEVAYTDLDPGEPNYTPMNGEARFVVAADMSGWGLTFGDWYEIEVTLTHDTAPDNPDIGAALHYALDIGEASPALSGYTEPATWAYPDYVRGDTTTQQVDDLRSDIVALGGYVELVNKAVPEWFESFIDAWFWSVRRWRWLHYEPRVIDGETETVGIRWHNGEEWQSASLPDPEEGQTWQVADLDKFAGLYSGSRYQINRARWAYESTEQ